MKVSELFLESARLFAEGCPPFLVDLTLSTYPGANEAMEAAEPIYELLEPTEEEIKEAVGDGIPEIDDVVIYHLFAAAIAADMEQEALQREQGDGSFFDEWRDTSADTTKALDVIANRIAANILH